MADIIEQLLNEVVNNFVELLDNSLVGIYLHGSLAMGSFNRTRSDIDLLIVTNHYLERRDKEKVIEFLINIENKYDCNPIEMSIILEDDIKNFTHPMPFILHHSLLHRDKYTSSKFICENLTDPDLTSHLALVKSRGKCLYGLPIEYLDIEISRDDFLKSVLNDLEFDETDLFTHPDYLILNLCRTLKYLYDMSFSSKLEGGKWAIGKFSSEVDEVIKIMIDNYVSSGAKGVEINVIRNAANYLMNKIYEKIN